MTLPVQKAVASPKETYLFVDSFGLSESLLVQVVLDFYYKGGGSLVVESYRGDLCAIVFYLERVRGKLYPKGGQDRRYAFANEVSRLDRKIVSKYFGIVRVPEWKRADVIEIRGEMDVVETKIVTDVVEINTQDPVIETEKERR